MTGDAHAAVAAGLAGAEPAQRALLRSIVDVARAIFRAQAASIFLLDEERDELVFEAVSGAGSDDLVGRRFPSSTGIAGWCLVTRQPLLLDEVRNDPRFGRGVAESTGYVPDRIMSVPLLHEERALGVLQVLDRARAAGPGGGDLDAMELLGLFGHQAAIALDLLTRFRRAAVVLEGDDRLAALARLAERLDASDRRDEAADLIAALERLLAP